MPSSIQVYMESAMNIRPNHSTVFCIFLTAAAFAAAPAHADRKTDMAEMQRQLNQETMSSGFQVEDSAKIDSYIKDAMQKDLKPKTKAPENWQPGYTCDSYYRRYYRYNYYGYRDCLYHYRYYGRYW